jgi:hypothetical protein
MTEFERVKNFVLNKMSRGADRNAVQAALIQAMPKVIESLNQMHDDPATSRSERLQIIALLCAIPKRLSWLYEAEAARDNAAARRQESVAKVIDARVAEKQVDLKISAEGKKLDRAIKKQQKELEGLNVGPASEA